jgi:hypothetical protein
MGSSKVRYLKLIFLAASLGLAEVPPLFAASCHPLDLSFHSVLPLYDSNASFKLIFGLTVDFAFQVA